MPGFAPTAGGSAPCSKAWGGWAEDRKLLLLFLHFRLPWRSSADGIVVDSYEMKRRPEAKRENFPLCSILCLGRPVHVRCDRRDGGFGIFRVSQMFHLGYSSDYGPILLVTARCGPACRVLWEGGGSKPPSYPS